MSHAVSRRRTIVLTAAVAVIIGVVVASLVVWPHPKSGQADILNGVLLQTFTAVGVLVTARRPGNIIGPMFVVVGGLAAIEGLSQAITARAVAHDSLEPTLVRAAAITHAVVWLPTLVIPIVFGMLLFPDGRALSPFFRRVAAVAASCVAVLLAAYATGASATSTAELVANSSADQSGGAQVFFAIVTIFVVAGLGCAVLGLVSLFLRYRRGNDRVRQQLKVVLLAGMATVACVTVSFFAGVGNVLEPIGVSLLATGAGVAILRYRLYDIDRIVSRTVSYMVVTGLLVGVYVGCVSLLTGVLPFRGDVGTAASVLVAVALFAPLRVRVQRVVDKRFNRSRYDAAATAAAFALRLRDQVDLDVVRADLLAAVAGTVEPAHASLWLRPQR